MGLTAAAIERINVNVGHCESFYLMYECPDTTEPVRWFWTHNAETTDTGSNKVVSPDRAVLSRYTYSQGTNDPAALNSSKLHIQLSPSGGCQLALVLCIFVAVVASYLFRHIPHLQIGGPGDSTLGNTTSLLALFAAVPSGLVGAVAYRGQTFSRRLMRGPRILVLSIAGGGVALGTLLGLGEGDHKFQFSIALVLASAAIYAVFCLAHICLGPRFRYHEDSRWPWLCRRYSPATLHRLQNIAATVNQAIAALVIAAFVRIMLYCHYVPTTLFASAAIHSITSLF